MHRFWKFALVLCLLTGLAAAQQKPAASSIPAKSTATKPAANLPSEEVVNAFLQQTFGYDSSLSWKIVSIKPSIAEGLAEVNITVVGPQGPSGQKLYITADGHHAVVGEILPFGAHPYDAARKRRDRSLPRAGECAGYAG
jgi:protein-disulfide isomerase